jgi:hypothetical protein
MSKIVAIDPGNKNSALVIYNCETKKPIFAIKCDNTTMLAVIANKSNEYPGAELVIEMVASYGMPVGRSIFDTCIWIGKFLASSTWDKYRLIVRKDVKMHLCATNRATDANIRQALIDRYGGTAPIAVGNKKNPGVLYQFSNDERAALALAITAAETPCKYELGE